MKRYREASSGDDSEAEVKSEPESDFEPSVSSSAAEDSEGSSAVESDAEDDFNPFGDDSDSDGGSFCGGSHIPGLATRILNGAAN